MVTSKGAHGEFDRQCKISILSSGSDSPSAQNVAQVISQIAKINKPS
jgi:hypothetical protein